jgi:type II secretory pathway pseudopilin PulG
MLFLVAIMGAMLAATGEVWYTINMRDKEKELLYVGQQYRQAIKLYFQSTPGPTKQYPKQLSDMLQDTRQQDLRRYLRKLYRDPVTGSTGWGLVTNGDGGIVGVYSLSEKNPFKIAGFEKENAAFEGKDKYSDWKFLVDGN